MMMMMIMVMVVMVIVMMMMMVMMMVVMMVVITALDPDQSSPFLVAFTSYHLITFSPFLSLVQCVFLCVCLQDGQQ